MKNKTYMAFIADIIDSKKIENRESVQKKLYKVIETINENFKDSIESKFIITLGDEFQGLLKNKSDLMQIIHFLQFEMHPIKFRIGLGIGEIQTSIPGEYALGADGPAYHHARSAINFVSKNEKSNVTYETSICLHPNKTDTIKLINLSLATYSSIFNSWDQTLFETVKLMEKGNTQQETSNILKLNQSSVKRRLEKANYYNFLHIHHVLTSIFEKSDSNE